jgi:hypothetical protein
MTVALTAPVAAQNNVSWMYRQQAGITPSSQNTVPWIYRQQLGITPSSQFSHPVRYYSQPPISAPAEVGIAAGEPRFQQPGGDVRYARRQTWVYADEGGGQFDRLGGGRWMETNDNGQFLLQQTGRTPQFIQLYDWDSGSTLRLFNQQLFFQRDGWQMWEPGYRGYWR